jgi:hypothetical protein
MNDSEILAFLEKQEISEIQKSNPFLLEAGKIIARKLEKKK